jgi:hypothetical protein
MEKKKAFEEPEVTTYDREELDLEMAITGVNKSELPSDRRLKENFQPLDPEEILSRLLRL